MGPDTMILVFWMVSFKPAFSCSSFTFIKRPLVPLHFLLLEWYHLRIWGCWYFLMFFLLDIFPTLIPAHGSSSSAFPMRYSAYKLNKQGDNVQPFEPVHCSMSGINCCFLSCIQVSQRTGQVIWYSHLLMNFPQFLVIHTIKYFCVVDGADVFWGIPLLFLWASGCWQFDLWFLCLF